MSAPATCSLILHPAGKAALDALKELQRAFAEAGISEEEWLEGARHVREALVRERWPHLFPAETESSRKE